MTDTNSKPKVVLVHGLWFGSWAMAHLARHLGQAGFSARKFSYSTTHHDLDLQVEKLFQFAVRDDGNLPHFIAHSMGGLVTLQMLQAHPGVRSGRVVLMGSPLRGSSVARQLSRWPAGRRLLGAAENTLIEGIRGWPEGREIGMVAGTLSMGLGVFAGGARLKSDGTVLAEESHHPALNDLVEIRTSHTGMLFSSAAAQQAVAFLGKGRFDH